MWPLSTEWLPKIRSMSPGSRGTRLSRAWRRGTIRCSLLASGEVPTPWLRSLCGAPKDRLGANETISGLRNKHTALKGFLSRRSKDLPWK